MRVACVAIAADARLIQNLDYGGRSLRLPALRHRLVPARDTDVRFLAGPSGQRGVRWRLHEQRGMAQRRTRRRPTTGGAVIYGVDVAGFNGGIVEKDSVLLNVRRDNPRVLIMMTKRF